MKYRTSARADEDIIDIYDYGLRDFGQIQAEKYNAGLARCFQFLGDNPRIARERREFTRPVRLYFYGSHVVVYVARDDHVLILRVLHGRQD